jgi:hypothetical protein
MALRGSSLFAYGPSRGRYRLSSGVPKSSLKQRCYAELLDGGVTYLVSVTTTI